MPIITAFAALVLMIGATAFMHGYLLGFETFIFGFVAVAVCMGL